MILPSKNEPGVHKVMEELEYLYPEAQLIVSNDGAGHGKGWAFRAALPHATGDTIVMLDADGDISPRMIARLLPFLADYDIVCGTKPISGRKSRRIISYFSRLYIALCFGIKCDSQTGIKVFRREAIPTFYSNRWLFDLEILSVAKQQGFSMIEVPIEYTPGNNKVKLISLWKTLKESITLWLELR